MNSTRIAFLVWASVACAPNVDLSGKSCPCSPGFVCDESRQVCVRPEELADAGTVGALEAGVSIPDSQPLDSQPLDSQPGDAGDVLETDALPSDAPPDDVRTATLVHVDDELSGGFGAGTFVNTEWDGTAIVLDTRSGDGSFISRVFDAREVVSWASLAWTPDGPYGRPLPDLGGVERAYVEGGADMRDNVLLLHFDDVSWASGSTVEDRSGRGAEAMVVAPSAPMDATEGIFGNAIVDTRSSYLYVDVSTVSDDLQFGTDDFTWSMWAKSTEECATRNRVFLGGEDDVKDYAHLWMGCAESASCPQGPPGGRLAGTFESNHNAQDGVTFCGNQRIDDGAWHHLAVVKSGHAPGTIRLYVDGEPDAVFAASFQRPILFPSGAPLFIGQFSPNDYLSAVVLDEIAIFKRALTSEEIRHHYQRGAFRLGFRVRTCSDPTCSAGERFVGPGNDETRFFTAAGVRAEYAALMELPRARYLQYLATFKGPALGQGPALRSVRIEAAEP